MSETVIVLQESSVLIGTGKSGQIPKLQETRKIPMEGYVRTFWVLAVGRWLCGEGIGSGEEI